MLISDIVGGVEVPIWVTIVVALVTAIATSYSKIKSTLETWIQGKQKIAEKKLDAELTELQKLKNELEYQTRKNRRLVKMNTTFTTAVMFMIGAYKKSNPENTEVIESLQELIKKSLIEENLIEENHGQSEPSTTT